MKGRKVATWTATIFGLLVLCSAAPVFSSSLVTFAFSGFVTFGEIRSTLANSTETWPLPGAPESGALITGYYTFDLMTPDRDSSTTAYGSRGAYLNAITQFYVNFGGLEYSLNFDQGGFTDIRIEDNPTQLIDGTRRDQYLVWIREDANPGTGIVGPSVNGFDPTDFQLDIFDWTKWINPDLITGDALPVVPPDLSLVDNPYYGTSPYFSEKGRLTMTYEGSSSTQARIYGELVSLTVVPEPTTLTLLGVGLAGIPLVKRRKAA